MSRYKGGYQIIELSLPVQIITDGYQISLRDNELFKDIKKCDKPVLLRFCIESQNNILENTSLFSIAKNGNYVNLVGLFYTENGDIGYGNIEITYVNDEIESITFNYSVM